MLEKQTKEIVKKIKNGKVGVIPTDTLLGLVGLADNKKTVERIYEIRKRDLNKPCIILISKIKELENFGVFLDKKSILFLKKIWPDKVTVVFPVLKSFQKKLDYLHKGTNTLAFRLPKPPKLISILKKTGPLIAPSANIQGMEPAKNIKEAKNYFEDKVDFYLPGMGYKKPSTVVKIDNNELSLLREGSSKFTRLKTKFGLK